MKLVNEYLKLKKKNDEFPNPSDFVVWLMSKKKSYKQSLDILREYKGLVYTHSISFLENKIGAGGRHSQNYVQLLAQYKKELEGTTVEDDKIVINFDLTNSSDNKIGGSNVKEKQDSAKPKT